MTTANTHKLFYGTSTKQGLIGALDIPEGLNDVLSDSRSTVRKHINDGLANWQTYTEDNILFRYSVLNQFSHQLTLRAKFKTQGSYQYKTLNDPAYKPPQEVDLDDGLFLPISFLEEEGKHSPKIMSEGFFTLIENILEPLCKEKKWELIKSKDSCIRIDLKCGAHLDIPLYAIPDDSYEALVESRKQAAFNDGFINDLNHGFALDEQIYKEIDFNGIRLAHRKDGWMESDPRKMEDWFEQQVKIHGEQLRRVCRYLKGWRDFNWIDSEQCKLSSITLMQCAVMAYTDLKSRVSEDRDDIALLEVTKKLPDYFLGKVSNPVVEGKFLNDNWTKEMQADYVEKARSLRFSLNSVLNEDMSEEEIIQKLRAKFGKKMPDDETLIVSESDFSAVEAYEPATMPQPHVKREISG